MKTITQVVLLALLFLSAAKHETITSSLQTNKRNAGNDTTFLLKEKRTDYYHAVFIERNRQSPAYKNVLDFKMDKFDREAYLQNYQAVKRTQKSHLKSAI